MAHPRLKPAKSVDYVQSEPLMMALSEARAARFLAFCTTDRMQSWEHMVAEKDQVDDHVDWIKDHAFEWLRDCHDRIEAEYRKLGTNLLMKDKLKDGA
jgi:hypothetical protein